MCLTPWVSLLLWKAMTTEGVWRRYAVGAGAITVDVGQLYGERDVEYPVPAAERIAPVPVIRPGERDKDQWASFLRAFNDWAQDRAGIPLLVHPKIKQFDFGKTDQAITWLETGL